MGFGLSLLICLIWVWILNWACYWILVLGIIILGWSNYFGPTLDLSLFLGLYIVLNFVPVTFNSIGLFMSLAQFNYWILNWAWALVISFGLWVLVIWFGSWVLVIWSCALVVWFDFGLWLLIWASLTWVWVWIFNMIFVLGLLIKVLIFALDWTLNSFGLKVCIYLSSVFYFILIWACNYFGFVMVWFGLPFGLLNLGFGLELSRLILYLFYLFFT